VAGPLIYIPGEKTATAADMDALGLAGLLDPIVTMMTSEVVSGGPDGGTGCLVHWDSAAHPEVRTARAVDLDSQDWQPLVPHQNLAAARAWLGLPKSGPLRAVSLRRGAELPGYPVSLRDGGEWMIPAAYWQGLPSLPCEQGLDPITGRECRTVLEEHRQYQEAAATYFRLFLDEATPVELIADRSLTVEGGFDYAVMALAKNYRVCRDMVNRLKLMGDVELVQVIIATLGVQVIAEIEEQKKNEELATIPAM
jgi:hypothetical protein